MLILTLKALLAISFFTHLSVGVYTWKSYQTSLSRPFSLTMLATAGWMFFYGFDLFGSDFTQKVLCNQLRYVCIAFVSLWWYQCVLRLNDRKSGPETVLPQWVYAIPVFTAILSLTSHWHRLFLHNFVMTPWHELLLLQSQKGPWFPVHLLFSISLLLLSMFDLGRQAYRSDNSFFFRRSLMLFFITLFPTLLTIIFALGWNSIPGYSLAPFFLSIIGLSQWYVLFRYNVFELVAIAKKTVFKSLSEGILIFATDERLVDFNPAAASLLGLTQENIIGRHCREIVNLSDFYAWFQSNSGTREFTLESPSQTVVLEATVTPIFDEQENLEGKGLIIRDITARHQAEKTLRESEERYRSLMESAPFPMLIIDHEKHRIFYVNPQGVKWSGFSLDDLVGKSPIEFYADPTQREQALTTLQQTGRIESMEVTFTLSEGRQAQALMSVRPMIFQKRKAALVSLVDITSMRDTEKSLKAVELRNRDLLVTEEERQRIGRDLHDDLGQKLTGVGFLAGALETRLRGMGIDDLHELISMKKNLQQMVQDARTMAHGLNPVELHGTGLWFALKELTEDASISSGLNCRLTPVEPVFIPYSEVALQLFRIAQEALNNALRHGQPRSIEISLTITQNKGGSLKIMDEGSGFVVTSIKSDGRGIGIMKFRAGLIGGTLQIDSTPGRGTTVSCSFPLNHTENHKNS